MMFLGGDALEGPRHIWWNFVSSSKERIEQAKQDWKTGRFAPFPTNMSSFRCRNELFPFLLSACPRVPARGALVFESSPMTTMLASDLPLPRIGRGKVRDIYAVGRDRVLLLTTDRISAFDVVMAETIPMKGAVLTQISAWWFNELEGVVPHHMISADADDHHRRSARAAGASRRARGTRDAVPAHQSVSDRMRDPRLSFRLGVEGICRPTARWPARNLPPGLLESAKLEPAIFSPATKAETGHDENITIARMREIIGDEATYTLESMTRAVYTLGEKISRDQGIIIADTKFEFGRDADGRIILIDEVMTPDSSRFWAADVYKPGQPQPSFDKQPLRDYLDVERRAGRWNGEAPPPPLPASVVDATSKRYLEAYRRITGSDLAV